MSGLGRAIAIAAQAHQDQKDKAGAPYILHPLRVMLAVEGDEDAHIAAVLHDVVEDSPWTLEQLRAEGFSERVLAAVDAVTKRPEEENDYEAFCRRAGADPIGRLVKMADLRDNLDLTRIPNPTPRDRERLEKYARALAMLEAAG